MEDKLFQKHRGFKGITNKVFEPTEQESLGATTGLSSDKSLDGLSRVQLDVVASFKSGSLVMIIFD